MTLKTERNRAAMTHTPTAHQRRLLEQRAEIESRRAAAVRLRERAVQIGRPALIERADLLIADADAELFHNSHDLFLAAWPGPEARQLTPENA